MGAFVSGFYFLFLSASKLSAGAVGRATPGGAFLQAPGPARPFPLGSWQRKAAVALHSRSPRLALEPACVCDVRGVLRKPVKPPPPPTESHSYFCPIHETGAGLRQLCLGEQQPPARLPSLPCGHEPTASVPLPGPLRAWLAWRVGGSGSGGTRKRVSPCQEGRARAPCSLPGLGSGHVGPWVGLILGSGDNSVPGECAARREGAGPGHGADPAGVQHTRQQRPAQLP